MRRFTEQEIKRIRQLARAGFGVNTIAKVFDAEPHAVMYHTTDIEDRMTLSEFIKALLPFMPEEGPPFPSGYMLTWEELRRLRNGTK